MSAIVASFVFVLTRRAVSVAGAVEVRVVECSDHRRRWCPPETTSGAQFVLVQRGRFRLRSHGHQLTIDPTNGYLQAAGHEAQFAHPDGGDVCTSITLSEGPLVEKIGSAGSPAVRVDARLELAHRTLLSTAADPDVAGVEAVLALLELAVRREPGDRVAPGRSALAERARDVILADEPAASSLLALARLLETSPAHLSRTFSHHTGMSLSRYRNRVRVSRALQRLGDGDSDLATLAVELGFSDQAHLTRTMQRELGRTPRRVHDQLVESGAEFERRSVSSDQ